LFNVHFEVTHVTIWRALPPLKVERGVALWPTPSPGPQ
jgi:hypothetical protein